MIDLKHFLESLEPIRIINPPDTEQGKIPISGKSVSYDNTTLHFITSSQEELVVVIEESSCGDVNAFYASEYSVCQALELPTPKEQFEAVVKSMSLQKTALC